MSALDAITPDSILACWCCEKSEDAIFNDPEVCHGQIVWKAWKYIQTRWVL